MSRLSIVIFGATGFTGKHVVRELARVSKTDASLTWGIAGRSRDKLQKVLEDISNTTGDDFSAVKLIVADVGDEKSLKEMCAQTNVLVNCCGPYRHYGEPVVRAAIDARAHYVDVSAEPQFIETMQLEYDAMARDAGVFIVSACGFDCIPNDMGVIYLQQNFGGIVNSVESYLSTSMPAGSRNGFVNYGTWESLVYGIDDSNLPAIIIRILFELERSLAMRDAGLTLKGLAHYNELPGIRKKMHPERLPTFKPKLLRRSLIHARKDGWCLPFPGSDASVVYRTQRHLYENEHKRPAQIKTYVKFPTLFISICVAFAAVILFILSNVSLTRNLLLKYPRFFSLGLVTRGPSEQVTRNTLFKFELFGEGWETGTDVDSTPPNKKVKAQVSGVNPGYGATAVALLYSALTVIREREHMPKQGGVMTTGVAFRNTKLIQHLCENNLKFEIVDNK